MQGTALIISNDWGTSHHGRLWRQRNRGMQLGMSRRFSKVLALLYLTLALVWVGGLGIFAVTGESLYDAFWQVGGGFGGGGCSPWKEPLAGSLPATCLQIHCRPLHPSRAGSLMRVAAGCTYSLWTCLPWRAAPWTVHPARL